MKNPISRLILCLTFAFFWSSAITFLHGQTVQQITNGESQQFDSNYEEPFNLEDVGHYISFTDDKVKVYKMDTKEKIYETSFDLCDFAVVDWFLEGQNIIYITYQSIILEHILTGEKEEYFYGDVQDDYLNINLLAHNYLGIVKIDNYPGPETVQFDIENRRFLDEIIVNHLFTTNDYFYHSVGFFGDSQFVRFNRSTYESDTLLSDYTPQGNVRSTDKHYLLTKEFPVMVVDEKDELKSYDFEHGTISSGIETSTGRLIFAETFADGTVIYEINVANSSLVRIDSIFSQERITLIDTYQDQLFVKYSSQYENYYGYMDHPYTTVDVVTEKLKTFTKEYIHQYEDLLVISHHDGDYLRELILIEKATGEIIEYSFYTYSLFLDDEIEILSTEEGLRFIVSEEDGRSIYKYDSASKNISFITTIDNKRGLGTSIQKNGDGYLVVNEHSLQSGFEYLHPTTKELIFHQVDGVLCGDVVPFEGKYFYIRNQDYMGLNENYYMDFIMFDPESEEIAYLEEGYFIPKDNFFTNVTSVFRRFGFAFINNTPLLFDLRKQIKISPEQEIVDLIERIYFESENYFYSYTGTPGSQKHYRVDRNDYENQELIYTDAYRRILGYDDESYVAIYPNEVYYVEEDKITTIEVPESFNPTYAGILNSQLLLRGFTSTTTIFKIYDLITDEESEIEVEGYALSRIGDYIISTNTFNAPYEYISTHIETGDTYLKMFNTPFSSLYSTDTSIYILDRELDEVQILNLQWEQLDVFDANISDNTSLNLISPPNTLPIIYKTRASISAGINRNIREYSLLVFDPRTNKISKYFECENELRFSNAFEVGPISTMLLRTEDDGYQLHKVELPEYGPVGTDDLSKKDDPILINPNPTDRFVSLDLENYKATLYNSVGIVINTYQNEKVLDLENVQSGIYYLKITSSDGLVTTAKIIKQ